MKKIIPIITSIAVILCLLYLSKCFFQSRKVEFILNQREPVEQKEEPKKEAEKLPVITRKILNWGFKTAESRIIDTIIIHTSYDALGDVPYSVEGLIKEYESYKVAPHYLIDRKGQIYYLVEEKDIAYHAGDSQMADGRKNVNDFSIGIELMNTKIGQITDEQYRALNWLIKDIRSRQEIKYVLGHNQVASNRKDDPWNLNWDKVDINGLNLGL